MYNMLTDAQKEYFDKTYGNPKAFTLEQECILARQVKKTHRTKKQVIDEMMKLGTRYLAEAYAGMQFPCKGQDPDVALNFGSVRRLREISESTLKEMTALREKWGHERNGGYGWEFEQLLFDIIDKIKTEGIAAKRAEWTAIKWDMYPEHLWPEKLQNDHDEAIRMNERIDKDREEQRLHDDREALLSQLTPEQRALLQA